MCFNMCLAMIFYQQGIGCIHFFKSLHYCLFYLATVKNKNFLINHESQDIKWFSREEVNDLANLPDSIKQMANKAFDLLNN